MANLKVNTVSGIGTEGPVLNGGLHFNSKNYLTLPKGTTTERTATSSGISTVIGAIRYNTDSNKMECYVNNKWMIVSTSTPTLDGGARGINGMGANPSVINTIEFVTISSAGNTTDFGDAQEANYASNIGTVASRTRGIFFGGPTSGGFGKRIEFITISSTGNATSFGDFDADPSEFPAGASNETRGIQAGGTTTNTIQFITIASTGAGKEFGDLTRAHRRPAGCASPTRGLFGGGQVPSPTSRHNIIDFITIASTGNAQDFGDLTEALDTSMPCSNSTIGVWAGGNDGSNRLNIIQFLTIATLGNAIDFGDLTSTRMAGAGFSSPTRGVFAGGYTPTSVNTIDYIALSTRGNAVDFGDMGYATPSGMMGLSNAHGGL